MAVAINSSWSKSQSHLFVPPDMPKVADPSRPNTLHSMAPPSLMSIQQQSSVPLTHPTNPHSAPKFTGQTLTESILPFNPNGPPPPGARPPTMRRGSRFDPMETTAEEEGHDELGSRHPLRRIREDLPPERSNSDGNVSLPGIKALLNAADQPVISFAPSFPSPSLHSSTSPLDSPSSRTSRFSSFASTSADGPGWWAPDERSNSVGYSSRSGSFSRGPIDDEPDVKRRRSDFAPTLPDADEVARLKWQAQSRNASFPASGSISAGSGLRSILYPPLSASSSISRGSFSGGTPLGSPLSPAMETSRDYVSSRGSPRTMPLTRSFADLSASERSPGDIPSRNRSPVPVERRSSLFLQNSSESLQALASTGPRDSVTTPTGLGATDGALQRLSLTRPPSPEPSTSGPRRKSLAELIKANSGDDIALAKGLFKSSPVSTSAGHAEQPPAPWIARRESTESVQSTVSGPGDPLGPDPDRAGPSVPTARRAAVAVMDPRPMDEEEVDPKSDPAMRGMEVLAESARRVADAERKDVDEPEPSPTKANNGVSSTGPKYTCNYCAKTFSRPSSLRIHTYSHTGERPFICKEPSCRRRFSVQSNLKRHAKVHQLQAQQVQVVQLTQRPGPPPRHPMHMGPGTGGPPPQPVYGYPPHPGGPPPHPGGPPPPHPGGPGPHPHMGPMTGYGPPPHGFMGPGRPGFDPTHGPPQHFHPPGVRPPGPPGEHMAVHYGMPPRRHSHDVDNPAGRGGRQEEWSEEEVDELDDDE